MKNNAKAFQLLRSLLLIFFQITIGLLGFILSGKLSQFSWLINMFLLWLGITLGMYLGGVPFFFQKSFTPQNSLVRLGTTALGAALPVLCLIGLGTIVGIQNVTYMVVAPLFAFLAIVLSLLGFFMPSWFSSKVMVA